MDKAQQGAIEILNNHCTHCRTQMADISRRINVEQLNGRVVPAWMNETYAKLYLDLVKAQEAMIWIVSPVKVETGTMGK